MITAAGADGDCPSDSSNRWLLADRSIRRGSSIEVFTEKVKKELWTGRHVKVGNLSGDSYSDRYAHPCVKHFFFIMRTWNLCHIYAPFGSAMMSSWIVMSSCCDAKREVSTHKSGTVDTRPRRMGVRIGSPTPNKRTGDQVQYVPSGTSLCRLKGGTCGSPLVAVCNCKQVPWWSLTVREGWWC